MKSKIITIFLVLSLVLLTGCSDSNKEKLSFNDSKLKLTTTFEYNKVDGFKKEKDVNGGKYMEIEFSNKKQNLYFDMYYSKSLTTKCEEVKNNRKQNKYYKDYKFGDYEAYTYGDNKNKLDLVIKIKTDNNENETIELFVAINLIDYNKDIEIIDLFKKDVIQNFFKSIKITED